MYYLVKTTLRDPRKYLETHKNMREHLKNNAHLKHFYLSKDGKHTFELWETSSRDWLRNHMEKYSMGTASYEFYEIDERPVEQRRAA